jgi:NF-kappa-B inhibitor-like protein 2
MKKYKEALEHQKMHLSMARKEKNLTEEQRALNNIGRTYFIWSDDLEGDNKLDRLSDAQKAYLDCLDVCDRLDGVVDEHEVMDMRARAYLNIGLIYESREMNKEALQFVKKAFVIAREQKDLQTMQKCHVSIGDIHMSSTCPSSALQAYEEALRVARKCKNKLQEVTALESMGKAFVHLEDFRGAKQSYRTAYKLCVHSDVRKSIAKSYLKVRRVVSLLYQVEDPASEMSARRESCDRLGDIFTGMNLPKLALKYYLKDLELTNALSMEKKTLSNVIASVAMTYEDLNDYHSAIEYFEKDLALWEHAPAEEYTSYIAIARNKTKAGYSYEEIIELYQKAFSRARQLNTRSVVSVCKHIVKLSRLEGHLDEAAEAESELQRILLCEPEAGESSDSEVEVEHGSSESTQDGGDLDLTPSESSSDDEERQIPVRLGEPHALLRVARRRKQSKLTKKNEKGETLLHIAAIQGNYKVADQLIKQGMRINEKDNFGWTPLHEACNWGHADVVELLLDNGALVNHSGRTGNNALTPLHDSCWNMHEDVVRILLDKGADPMVKNGNGQTPLAQVTEMLKLTKETLANSKDRRKQAEIAEKSRNARCLENIATMLMAKMPRKEVELDLNNTAVSVDRDCRLAKMKDGASAFQSSSYLSTHFSTQKELNERIRDRSGKNMLVDDEDECITAVTDPCRSSSFTRNTQTSLPATPTSVSCEIDSVPGLYHVSSDDDNEPGTDNWLLEDDCAREPARKRRRENSKPSQSQSSTPYVRNCTKRHTSNSTVTRQRRSFEQDLRAHGGNNTTAGGTSSNVVYITDDCEEIEFSRDASVIHTDPPSPQNVPVNFRSESDHYTQPQPLGPTSIRVRVTVKEKTFLVACPLSKEAPFTVARLAEQASERYLNQYGERPHLSLTTKDGAQLFTGDLVSDVLTQNEEVIGIVETCDPSPVNQYTLFCKQAGKSPQPQILHRLKSEGIMSSLDVGGCHLPDDSLHLLLKCAHRNWTAMLELSLKGNKLSGTTLQLLASSICKLSQLKLLNLTSCGITSDGITTFSSSLRSQAQGTQRFALEELQMSYNSLKGSELSFLDVLRLAASLRRVDAEHCNLRLAVLFNASQAYEVFGRIPALKLGGNSVSDHTALCSILSKAITTGVQDLDLSNTQYPTSSSLQNLSCVEARPLSALSSLCLSDCSLTDDLFRSIASLLASCSTCVREYSFSCNAITARSAASITR